MIPETSHKSIYDNEIVPANAPGRMPLYGWAGLVSLVVFQILLLTTENEFVGRYFTPIQWTGLVLLLDGWLKRRRGRSLLSDYPLELLILALISIPSWVIFEGYNVLLGNWRYLDLPDSMWVRYIGYAWAFATISPGMFLIYETIDELVPGKDPDYRPRLSDGVFWGFVIFGAACLIVPLIWPSPWMTPLVWMGFAFFLDPINSRAFGERSILSEFFTGHYRSMLLFFLAGFVAGIFWEFWNYWAFSKWEYNVPYLGHIKLFEMPVLGFLGFMPFIVESFAIYKFIRHFLPIRIEERYLG